MSTYKRFRLESVSTEIQSLWFNPLVVIIVGWQSRRAVSLYLKAQLRRHSHYPIINRNKLEWWIAIHLSSPETNRDILSWKMRSYIVKLRTWRHCHHNFGNLDQNFTKIFWLCFIVKLQWLWHQCRQNFWNSERNFTKIISFWFVVKSPKWCHWRRNFQIFDRNVTQIFWLVEKLQKLHHWRRNLRKTV